jgi:hypothetical protein
MSPGDCGVPGSTLWYLTRGPAVWLTVYCAHGYTPVLGRPLLKARLAYLLLGAGATGQGCQVDL